MSSREQSKPVTTTPDTVVPTAERQPTAPTATNSSERALRSLARSLGASAARDWFRLLLTARDLGGGSTGQSPPRQ